MKPLALIAGASLLALAGATASAQTPPAPPAGTAPQSQAQRNDAEALLDARIAGVRAGLRLTPEQERLFAPVEQAYRARQAERARRMDERQDRRTDRSDDRDQLDFMQRLDRRAERSTQNAQSVASFAAAMRPFWNSLDENQKRLLPRLLQAHAAGGHRGMMRHHRDHHGGRGHDRGEYRRMGGPTYHL